MASLAAALKKHREGAGLSQSEVEDAEFLRRCEDFLLDRSTELRHIGEAIRQCMPEGPTIEMTTTKG